jgi:hypothetical protein
VQIGQSDFVDGGLHGAASLDLAIEAGADLVVCINPMVPLDAAAHADKQYIRRKGLHAIINQTVRTLLHSTVRYHVKSLRAKYPDVDIILIQPNMADYAMFSFHPMHYRTRLAVAEHGFMTVTRGLLENYDYFSTILARHHIPIARRRVSRELAQMEEHPDDLALAEQIILHPEEVETGNGLGLVVTAGEASALT